MNKSIFFKPTNPALARKISITSPNAFKKSIQTLKKGGLTSTEKKALVLARTRTKAQLSRSNLSSKEVKQFRVISKMKV